MYDPHLSGLDCQLLRLSLRLAVGPEPPDVHPDPFVGAVLLPTPWPGSPIKSGVHARRGGIHAEPAALAAAGAAAEGSTLYCNLEPCAYEAPTKRQPPCSEAILAAGINRVVIGQLDPHPRVRGRGIRRLRSVGVRVDVAADPLPFWRVNPVFTTGMALHRAFVHLVTSDGMARRARRAAYYECELDPARAETPEPGTRSVLLRVTGERGTAVGSSWTGPLDFIDGRPAAAWIAALHAALDGVTPITLDGLSRSG